MQRTRTKQLCAPFFITIQKVCSAISTQVRSIINLIIVSIFEKKPCDALKLKPLMSEFWVRWFYQIRVAHTTPDIIHCRCVCVTTIVVACFNIIVIRRLIHENLQNSQRGNHAFSITIIRFCTTHT